MVNKRDNYTSQLMHRDRESLLEAMPVFLIRLKLHFWRSLINFDLRDFDFLSNESGGRVVSLNESW